MTRFWNNFSQKCLFPLLSGNRSAAREKLKNREILYLPMDYDKVIRAAYNWFSLKDVAWFLVFFWIAMPILVFLPSLIEKQFYGALATPLVSVLYIVIYLSVIVGFIALLQNCLQHKNLAAKRLSPRRFVRTVALVFVELFYIFVWNLHRPYRVPQLLLIIGSGILYIYSRTQPTLFIVSALILFLLVYLVIVIYNSIRISFSMLVFYNKDIPSLKDVVKESWALTHRKFPKVFFALLFSVICLAVIFVIIAVILGGLSYLVLLNYLIPPLAYKFSMSVGMLFALAPVLLGYYYAVIEIYSQLEKEHASSKHIKHYLSRRVLAVRAPVRRSFAKKKIAKKKRR